MVLQTEPERVFGIEERGLMLLGGPLTPFISYLPVTQSCVQYQKRILS